MTPAARAVVADRGDAGRRLDLVLRRHLTGVERATRARIQTWISEGQVAIDGVIVRRAAARTAMGAVVTVALPSMAVRRPVLAEPLALRILHEDEHLLVVDKPAGMVVHPTYRHPTGTLLNGLLWRARTWRAGERPSIVGRLDKMTSGLVVVARSAAMHAALQREMASNHARKEYLAVVFGRVDPERGSIDLRLARHPGDRRRVVASPDRGSASVTFFECLSRGRTSAGTALSLLRCRLATGRMHQIRVHLSARGWPLVGDAKYGDPADGPTAMSDRRHGTARDRDELAHPDDIDDIAVRACSRQALHAWRLTMTHPRTGSAFHIEAPLPDDMVGLLRAAGLAMPSDTPPTGPVVSRATGLPL